MFLEKWRRYRGFQKCPKCYKVTFKFEQDIVISAEEPPLLGHWRCLKCGAQTGTESLAWADEIVKEYGFETFKEALWDKKNR